MYGNELGDLGKFKFKKPFKTPLFKAVRKLKKKHFAKTPIGRRHVMKQKFLAKRKAPQPAPAPVVEQEPMQEEMPAYYEPPAFFSRPYGGMPAPQQYQPQRYAPAFVPAASPTVGPYEAPQYDVPTDNQAENMSQPPAFARMSFLRWLAKWNPTAYQRVSDEAPELLDGLGAEAQAGVQQAGGTNWGDKLLSVIGPALQAYNQQKIMKMQIQRAEQGLPPLPTEQLAPPPMTARLGLDDKTLKMVGLGVAAIAGAVMVPKLLRKARA